MDEQIVISPQAMQELANKVKEQNMLREQEIRASIVRFTPEEMYEFLESYVEPTELVLDGLAMASSMHTLSESGAICYTALEKLVAGINYALDWLDNKHNLGKMASDDNGTPAKPGQPQVEESVEDGDDL